MPEMRLNRACEFVRVHPSQDGETTSAPERELLSFIDSVATLIGTGSTRVLTEIWLDELACMDCMPNADSTDWRIVSLAASTTLASKIIAWQVTGPKHG